MAPQLLAIRCGRKHLPRTLVFHAVVARLAERYGPIADIAQCPGDRRGVRFGLLEQQRVRLLESRDAGASGIAFLAIRIADAEQRSHLPDIAIAMSCTNDAQGPHVLIAFELELQSLAEPFGVPIDGLQDGVGIRRIAALDEAQRFDLLLLGLGQLVHVEQRARHAIEQLDLRFVVQPVGAAADGTGFRVGRDGIHVVVGFVIVVTESRQRRDREGRERPVDGTVHLDSGEIVLRGELVQLGLPLRVGEVDVRLGSLQALGAELVESGRDELLVGGHGIAFLDDQIGNGVRRLDRVGGRRGNRSGGGCVGCRCDGIDSVDFGLRECCSARDAAAKEVREHPCAPRAMSWLAGRCRPHRQHSIPKKWRAAAAIGPSSPAAPRHKFRLKSGTFSVCRYEQVSIMARRRNPTRSHWFSSRSCSRLMDPTDTHGTEYFHRVVDCQWACPAHTDVPEYIRLVAQGRFGDAYLLNRESNVFPGILGRVCDRPCEPACRRGRVEEKPVAICRLKRVAADYRGDIEHGLPRPAAQRNGRRIALIGAGCASLTVANDLAPMGYECVIFEALDRPGGLMRTNIPAFRLPAEVLDEEIGYVTRLGVDVRLSSPVHSLRSLLDEDFAAVFVGSGAPKGKDLRLPGRDASERIHIGIDWLGSIAFGHIESVGERVLIIGVGNTAMDCCRSSLRLGANNVKVIARKPRQFFKASEWELEDAEEERVDIVVNHSPKEFVIENGKLVGMRFDELEYELDGAGEIVATKVVREVFLPCDDVVLAIGQENAFPWIERDAGVEFDRHDVPIVDPATFQSTRPGVFFGGDAAFGPKNIIWAVQHGHEAAISIHKHCEGTSLATRLPRGVTLTTAKMGIHEWSYSNGYEPAVRRIMPHVDLKRRFKKLDIEVELGFSAEQVATEVERCLNCDLQTVFTPDLCIECDACIDVCPVDCLAITPNGSEAELTSRLKAARLRPEQPLFVSAPLKQTARVMLKDENLCVHCGLCAERCPTGAWDMQKSTVTVPYARDEARLGEEEWQNSRKAG